jgi:archaemetzincin
MGWPTREGEELERGEGWATTGQVVVRLVLGSVCVGLLVLGLFQRAPRTAFLEQPLPAYEAAQDRPLELRPVWPLLEKDLGALAESLGRRTGLPVVIGAPVVAPRALWHPRRRQLQAERVLDWLFYQRPPELWGVMAVTADDLSTTEEEMIYGLANLRDRVAVVSLYRFAPELASDNPDTRQRAQEQLSRAAFHEVGHMLGLPHCERRGCLMGAIKHRDEIGPRTAPCADCVRSLQRRLKAAPAPVMETLYRGDGYFHRGHLDEAHAHYLRALELLEAGSPPWLEAEAHNRIGASLIASQRPAAARPWVDRALALDPGLAPARFNDALILGMAGEEAQALRALERWEALVPDSMERAEMSARFFLDVIGDGGSALVALRRYEALGGDDPALLGALARLDQPGFVVFRAEEVEAIQIFKGSGSRPSAEAAPEAPAAPAGARRAPASAPGATPR